MSDHSRIEWTEASYNPIRAFGPDGDTPGWFCVPVSAGCKNCYASTMNKRLGNHLEYKAQNLQYVRWTLSNVEQPVHWKRPRRIFVCSMTDLFAEWVPDEWIDQIFAIMACCPQHTFQVLTKRAERMRDYINDPATPARVHLAVPKCFIDRFNKRPNEPILSNIWLGVSVENQAAADERIPLLLQTTAVVRWLSCEPLLGPISLDSITDRGLAVGITPNVLTGQCDVPCETYFEFHRCACTQHPPRINWVVVGGESGPGARPMNPAWARTLRDECQAAGVPYFFKQWGEYQPAYCIDRQYHPIDGSGDVMTRVGKKAAGRLLDGKHWDEYPEVKQA